MAGQQSITNINAIAVARGTSSPSNTEVLWLKPSNNPKVYEDLQIYDGSNWILVSRTPNELLSDLKTVDGKGSGLDSDTLQGYTPAQLMLGQSIPALSVGELLVGQADTVGAAKTVSGIVTVSATGAFVYVANSISHTGLTDIGTNTHAQIDSHISDSAIHVSTAQATKLSNITITQAVDLDQMEIDVTANNAKAGITPSQASAITANTAKVSNITTNLSEGTSTTTTVDVNSSDGSNATLASASTTRAGLMSKVKFDEVVVNNAKVGLTSGQITILNNTSGTNTGDQDISGIATNTSNIATNVTAIALNTAKVTNATHTGEVTGSGALTISDDIVDEANLKVSNAPTNGYVLTAQSGNTGGLTWAEAAGGDNLATADLTQTDQYRRYTFANNNPTKLYFSGANSSVIYENGCDLELWDGTEDSSNQVFRFYNTGGGTGNISMDNGGTTIVGNGSTLTLSGHATTTNLSRVVLGANIQLITSGTREVKFQTRNIYFKDVAGLVDYGHISDDEFYWGATTPIGSEKFSIQVDTLVKGSDNSASTSGFKVTDVNNAVRFDVRNNGDVYLGSTLLSPTSNNLANADLTQTDLERVYTRSATAGVSRLKFQGSSHIFTMEDASKIEMYTGKHNDATPLKGIELSSGASGTGNITLSNGRSKIQGVNSDLFLYGQFGNANQSKIQLGANLLIETKANRNLTLKTGILYFNNISSNVGAVKSDVFIWGSINAIGSEKFSIQVDTLIKGSDNAAATSGFKVTDVNDLSLLEVRNSGALKLQYLPSLSAGVGAGDVWSQNGTLRIGSPTTNVQTVASATTLTANIDVQKLVVASALASALTIAAPTGTPLEGQELTFRIKDDGTARALTWNAIFVDYTGALPTTTVASKTVYIGCKYNVVDTKWDVVAVQVQP